MSLSGQWKRFGCCPLDQDDIPSSSQNLAIFEMKGYNYRTIPIWFDSTMKKMMPLQFSVLYDKLYYRWTFYRHMGDLCQNKYYLSTSDDIVPTIDDGATGKRMEVKRIARHNGYTTWMVKC